MTSQPRALFLQARDFLLENRTDYASAYRGFQWPERAHFNWALDYFDPMAAGNERPALWVVDENGSETRLSFAPLAERSNRAANFLRPIGVKRGDCILVMMGNEVALWDIMLAVIKLGAADSRHHAPDPGRPAGAPGPGAAAARHRRRSRRGPVRSPGRELLPPQRRRTRGRLEFFEEDFPDIKG